MNLSHIRNLIRGLESDLYNEIIEHADTKEVKAGDTILKAGQVIRSAIIILDGTIKLYREDEEGKEFFIYNLNPGQACSLSMVCAVRQEKSEVLAVALTDATLLTIPFEKMEEWVSKYKSWYRFVITTYRDRFEELLRTIDAIAFSNMDDRLVNYIQKQAEILGPVLKMTHQDIARDLNTSREVISRLLKKMEAKGWLHINRNSIEWLK